MPELPEVQTIVDDLNRKIKGETIVSFWSAWAKGLNNPVAKFREAIKNKKIINVERKGKYIILNLDGGKAIAMHLRMTGHLLVKSEKLKVKSYGRDYFEDRVNQYVRHIFYLKGGKTIEFSDVRKFGKLILADAGKLYQVKGIKDLGVDAMSSSFDLLKLNKILDGRKTKIKELLLNQTVIAGIGNIYASEILHEAGILPDRASQSLVLAERKKLYSAIKKILKKAIRMRGTSDSDYRDTSGAPGNFQKALKVYRRAGKKCAVCGTIIQRKVIGQRSTFYCPKCQK
ncbi:MAG: bifunctional DNA-formamidopyrimidine glycosylase/DNA-(apurinic or apyrimidinic site) lyase [Parcubacteria group bacterium]|jgi:formamidopyrimidine-DNA glycosylase